MATHKIAIVKGDGIGVDVVNEGMKVLDALAPKYGISWDYTEFPWGSDYYFEHDEMMPANALDTLADFNAVFLGAVGHPDIQDNITLDGLLLPIRRRFDQYICLRPSVLYPGVTSPLSGKNPYDIDLTVVRENTEGEYLNIGGFAYHGSPDEVAIQTAVFTRKGCERAIRYAFDLARERGKKNHVTSVTKSNALGYMTIWDRTFEDVAEEYPDIDTTSLLIDAACMDLVRRDGRTQLVWRHHYRCRGDHQRQSGAGLQCQHQPRQNRSLDVRAHSRIGPRHRGAGHRQPDGTNTDRSHDAAAPRGRRSSS